MGPLETFGAGNIKHLKKRKDKMSILTNKDKTGLPRVAGDIGKNKSTIKEPVTGDTEVAICYDVWDEKGRCVTNFYSVMSDCDSMLDKWQEKIEMGLPYHISAYKSLLEWKLKTDWKNPDGTTAEPFYYFDDVEVLEGLVQPDL